MIWMSQANPFVAVFFIFNLDGALDISSDIIQGRLENQMLSLENE